MRWLEDLLEHSGVKVLTPQDILFTWLFDLDNDGDDEEDEDDTTGDTNNSPICVVQVVQDVGFPLFCTMVEKPRVRGGNFRSLATLGEIIITMRDNYDDKNSVPRVLAF